MGEALPPVWEEWCEAREDGVITEAEAEEIGRIAGEQFGEIVAREIHRAHGK